VKTFNLSGVLTPSFESWRCLFSINSLEALLPSLFCCGSKGNVIYTWTLSFVLLVSRCCVYLRFNFTQTNLQFSHFASSKLMYEGHLTNDHWKNKWPTDLQCVTGFVFLIWVLVLISALYFYPTLVALRAAFDAMTLAK
jgi:hypothetical protein